MRQLSAIWFSLRSLLRRGRTDADLDEELAFHLERESALLEREGLSPPAARREARMRFGGVQRYREECRDVRQVSWWADFQTDVRFALRLARHRPLFAGNVLAIAALGVATCVTTFSLVSGILLTPLAFPDPDRVFHLYMAAPGGETRAMPIASYLELAQGSPAIDAIGAGEPTTGVVQLNGETLALRAFRVTPSFFRVFRIRPELGRFFDEVEAASRAPVVVLGHEEWMARWGGDRAVIGRQLMLNDAVYTIIGVMPPRFRAQSDVPRALWYPLPDIARRRTVSTVLRIADSVTPEQAQAILARTARARIGVDAAGDSITAFATLAPAEELIIGGVRRPLLILLAAVLLVLALVAANVATMFLAHSAARSGELDVRRALGASAGRQVRQLLTESMTLTAIGGAIGIALSLALIRLVRAGAAGLLPRLYEVSLDWRVLLFAVAAVMLTGCAGGIAQAFARSGNRLGNSAGRVSPQRTSSALVVAQVALSLVLLVGAGLLVKGFLKVAPTNPGFALENRAMIETRLRGEGPPGLEQLTHLATEIAARMRGVPGVEDVAITSFMPLTGVTSLTMVEPVGGSLGKPVPVNQNNVTPNFFTVMSMRVSRGRAFSASDVGGSEPVAIISEAAAARWFPGADPVGRRLSAGEGDQRVIRTVVGVVNDVRMAGTDTRLRPQLYVPVAQAGAGMSTFLVATSGDPAALLPELRRAVFAAAPRSVIDDASTMTAKASGSVSRARFYSIAMGMFAVAAVILSALGVYGLLAFAVAQRTREIGIRLALGATAGRVGRLVLRRALAIGVVGVVIGIAIARALSRYMESVLLEVTPTDYGVFTIAAAVAFGVAVIAACGPVYQAIRVDPIRTLRS